MAGFEFAGTVVSAPTAGGPVRFPVGSRVFGATQGAYAELVCAAEQALRPVPFGWTPSAAAALFITAPTSYGALVARAGVKAGDWVLVHAAAGGVGLAAVQSACVAVASVPCSAACL